MPMKNVKLDYEIDTRLSHIVDGGVVALDVPDNHAARLTLFEHVRARGDKLYGARGYRTALVGPRLIITRVPPDPG